MKKLILSMTLMTAVFFVSCDQNSESNDDVLVKGSTLSYEPSVSGPSKLTGKSAGLLAADCTPVSGNAVVNRVTGGLTGNYCAWTPTAKVIGTANVQFEGIYGSGFRPTSSGWYAGVVAPSYTCTSGWSAIASAITVKNSSAANIGTDPSCGTFIPENTLGADGSAYGLNFGLGYYNYDSSTRVITITKKVVIWKDESLSAATAYSNPTKTDGSITEAYLVEITSIVPTHGASVFGTVSYTYTKVL
ncbi:hypothetical protein AAEO57_10190 [Flavobacterium sp. DGU38]|uniref:Lipoprotein n=1 Tax=Flavobacterium calami TaxID=3139144 RepID=A0ABU9INY7_9FLAO